MEELFDVIATNISTGARRVIASGKTRKNAEAIENMAVMRRGGDEEFFAVWPHGQMAEIEKIEKQP